MQLSNFSSVRKLVLMIQYLHLPGVRLHRVERILDIAIGDRSFAYFRGSDQDDLEFVRALLVKISAIIVRVIATLLILIFFHLKRIYY